MLFAKVSPDGDLEACIDYYLVDDQGKITLDGSGTHVWVEQLHISTGVNGAACIRYFIREIAKACPQAISGYWVRKDKTGMALHEYRRHRLTRKEVGV